MSQSQSSLMGGWIALNHDMEFNHHGEYGSVDMNIIAEQRPEIAKILALYEYEGLYNMDERGIYFRG